MVRIVLPSVWTQGGQTMFEAVEGQLHDILRRFAADHPHLERRLFGPNAEPLLYLNICVDNDLIPRHLRANTTVSAGSTITIIAPMAGG